MKINRAIWLSCAAVGFGLATTGCIVQGPGFRVVHVPPPPPRIIRPPAEVVVVPPPPVVVRRPTIVVEPPREVVVQAREVARTEPVHTAPEVVVRPPAVVHVPPGHEKREAQPVVHAIVVFSSHEREVIHAYVKGSMTAASQGNKGKGLPPGLAKKVERGGQLPPGWQNKCVRGAVVPPEIYAHCQPLPQEIVIKLPPAPPNTIVVTVDGRVLRLA